MIEEREKQKSQLLENFTVGYLEEMLKSTTKSIARDVVKTLIDSDSSGVLLSLEKQFKKKVTDQSESKDYDEEEEKVEISDSQQRESSKAKNITETTKNSQSTNQIPSKNQTATNWKNMERSSSLQKGAEAGVKFPSTSLSKQKPKASSSTGKLLNS